MEKYWLDSRDLLPMHLPLSEMFEGKLQEFNGNLPRAAVELAKQWRSDKVLRKLEAMLIVMDEKPSAVDFRYR